MSTRATIYLVLAIIGTIVPLVVFGVFVADHGLDLDVLGDQVFNGPAATAVALDVSLSSVVFWIWMSREAPKVGMRFWWPLVVANLLIGLSCALPLFLFYRERRLAAAAAE